MLACNADALRIECKLGQTKEGAELNTSCKWCIVLMMEQSINYMH